MAMDTNYMLYWRLRSRDPHSSWYALYKRPHRREWLEKRADAFFVPGRGFVFWGADVDIVITRYDGNNVVRFF